MKREKNASGRSMIEMLGVLAIIGVLSVGGIAGYSKAMEKFKINKTIEQIAQITANVQTLYAQQTTFDGLNNESAIAMGVVPSELGTAGGTLTNLFGNSVEIWGDGDSFIINFHGMTKEACITLATTDWGSSSTGLRGILINYLSYFMDSNYSYLIEGCTQGEIVTNNYYACAGYLPITPAIAGKYCGQREGDEDPWINGFGIKFHK